MQKKYKIKILVLLIIFIFGGSTVSFAEMPATSASSAIVMEAKSGRILYKKNIHQKLPMASTTKIMTALVALERGDINAIVKTPKQAVGVEGSSIYLGHDEKVKLEDLLYGLMLRSGNDAAVSIANHIGGTEDKFIEIMNNRAREIGAANTSFMNPHGLHDDNHYTTAYDLALISREALQKAEFKKIAKTKLWVADREGYKHFYNKNDTITGYEGGDGIKIGYTRAAGRCLAASATRDGIQLICVVLNDGNWFQDAYSLFDHVFEKYKPHYVLKKDEIVKTIMVKNGEKESTKIVPKEDVWIPLCEEEISNINVSLEINDSIEAPVVRGKKVGKAVVYLNDTLLYTTDLLTREDIPVKVPHRMKDWLQKKMRLIGLVNLGVK